MRSFIIAATTLFGALAAASETVQVKDFSLRQNNGIQAASFNIQPANVECSSTSADELKDNSVVNCGETEWRFAVEGSNSEYTLTLYKQTAPAAGITGKATFQPYCHAGGNGANDFVCTQVSDISIVLKS